MPEVRESQNRTAVGRVLRDNLKEKLAKPDAKRPSLAELLVRGKNCNRESSAQPLWQAGLSRYRLGLQSRLRALLGVKLGVGTHQQFLGGFTSP